MPPITMSWFCQTGNRTLDGKILEVIATVVECCEEPRGRKVGHPPAETVRVVGSLRRFLREGTPWRSLTATEDQVSGSTLRRRLRTGPRPTFWAGSMRCW